MPYDDGPTCEIVDIQPFMEAQHSALFQQVQSYWLGMCQGTEPPIRSQIDPRNIEDALEYAFVGERIAQGLVRIRIAGMHLSDLLGMETRGMPMTGFFTPHARRMLSEHLEECFSTPAVVEMRLSAERSIGKPALDARILLLPLRDDLGDVTRVLGVFKAEGHIGRAPRRFNIHGVTSRRIVDLVRGQNSTPPDTAVSRLISTSHPVPRSHARPRRAAPQVGIDETGQLRKAGASHLTLIVDNDG